MDKVNVVSPVGLPLVEPTTAAKRLKTLEGMTIGEVWNGDFKGDVTFPIIRKLLQDRYPSLRFVPFTEFPYSHVSDNATRQRERASLIADLAREKGCHAVITGNGA